MVQVHLGCLLVQENLFTTIKLLLSIHINRKWTFFLNIYNFIKFYLPASPGTPGKPVSPTSPAKIDVQIK